MIIAISGKIGSGKDTVGKIIQYLTCGADKANIPYNTWDGKTVWNTNPHDWQIKKFADKLKDIACLLIGCTREQLEDQEFKHKPLPKKWWVYKHEITYELISWTKQIEDYELGHAPMYSTGYNLVETTPRLLLQLIGTECGRNIIHPNIWVNALMNEYKLIEKQYLQNGKIVFLNDKYPSKVCIPKSARMDVMWDIVPKNDTLIEKHIYPNWIITDMRFPNELQAVKDREGITIRTIRYTRNTSETWQKLYPKIKVLDPDGWSRDERYQFEWYEEPITLEEYKNRVMRSTCKFNADFDTYYNQNEHESETALDNATFDYVIDNNGTINELIEKVKEILIKENIIK